MTTLRGLFDLDVLPALLRRAVRAAERPARRRELSMRPRALRALDDPQQDAVPPLNQRIEAPPADSVTPAPRPEPPVRGDDHPAKPPLRHIQMRSHIGP